MIRSQTMIRRAHDKRVLGSAAIAMIEKAVVGRSLLGRDLELATA